MLLGRLERESEDGLLREGRAPRKTQCSLCLGFNVDALKSEADSLQLLGSVLVPCPSLAR